MLPAEVGRYYRQGGERHRLASGVGRLEFLRTMDLLGRALPTPPARLLDVGGATGVYAEPLAAAGYEVQLIDPLPEHVAEAKTRPGVTATLGDARALPVADASVDAVLLLGPLYHLLDRADRVAAWAEARRAVRPGGLVAAATICRYASLIDGITRNFVLDPGYGAIVDNVLVDGVHRNTPDGEYFTSAYFHHPDEIPAEVGDAGLTLVRRVAVEGPLWIMGHGRLDEVWTSEDMTDHLLAALRRFEDDTSLLGASSHLLTFARR